MAVIKDKILVIEDEKSINYLIGTVLTANGYDVIKAYTGTEACQMLDAYCPDLIILDLGLPDMDGVDIIRRIRGWSVVPIIVVSARTRERDKIEALDLGADDYLTKPFSVIELVSRVKAVLRRCQPEGDGSVLRSGEVSLDTRAHTVLSGGERVDLTYKEYELLRLFLSHPGTAYTRDRLMELVWGMDYCGESRTVDMHIRTLRQKLGKAGAHITTVRGVGYRWEETI